jgi:signal peptidase II
MAGEQRSQHFWFGAALAGTVLAADQVSKAWILHGIRLQEVTTIDVSQIFDLSFVKNYGVSFGLLRAGSDFERWLLVGLSALISALFISWLRTAPRRFTAVALGLVIGGAIGNLIDRAMYGYVVDFLDFSGIYPPHFFNYVFNVADAAISVGAVLLIADYFIHGEAPDPAPSKEG